MTIEMFQVIDINGVATETTIYRTKEEAVEAAGQDQAVEMLTFEYSDSELVWTPDGSDTWPPEDNGNDSPAAFTGPDALQLGRNRAQTRSAGNAGSEDGHKKRPGL